MFEFSSFNFFCSTILGNVHQHNKFKKKKNNRKNLNELISQKNRVPSVNCDPESVEHNFPVMKY